MKRLVTIITIVGIILLIILLITFGYLLSTMADAKLSDETLEEVERLRMKHYGSGKLIYVPNDSDILIKLTPKKPEYFFVIEDVPNWYDSSDYFIDDRLKILINGEIYWIRLEKDE